PSVYKHFPSKAGLLYAIARRAADRLALGAEEAFRVSKDESEALRRMVRSYVRVLTGFPELVVGISVDGTNIPEQDRAEGLRVQRDYVAQWGKLLLASQSGLTAREAMISLHAALTYVNDLGRILRAAYLHRLYGGLVA